MTVDHRMFMTRLSQGVPWDTCATPTPTGSCDKPLMCLEPAVRDPDAHLPVPWPWYELGCEDGHLYVLPGGRFLEECERRAVEQRRGRFRVDA